MQIAVGALQREAVRTPRRQMRAAGDKMHILTRCREACSEIAAAPPVAMMAIFNELPPQ